MCLRERLSELEVHLAGRRRFYLYWQRQSLGSAAAAGAVETLRALVRERSWDGAVDACWHLSIANHGGALEQQRARADEAAAQIRAHMTPQEATNE
jgi:hypothetical protein